MSRLNYSINKTLAHFIFSLCELRRRGHLGKVMSSFHIKDADATFQGEST